MVEDTPPVPSDVPFTTGIHLQAPTRTELAAATVAATKLSVFAHVLSALAASEGTSFDSKTVGGVWAPLNNLVLRDSAAEEAARRTMIARLLKATERGSAPSLTAAAYVHKDAVSRWALAPDKFGAALLKPGAALTHQAAEGATITTWFRLVNKQVAHSLAELSAVESQQDDFPVACKCRLELWSRRRPYQARLTTLPSTSDDPTKHV